MHKYIFYVSCSVVKRNPLDPWNDVHWDRPDIFATPLAAEMAPQGIVTRVDLMLQQQTGLPQLTTEKLTNFTLGSYGVNLANGYVTSMVVSNTYVKGSTFN